MGKSPATSSADGDSRKSCPQYINQEPALAEFTQLVHSQQSEAEHDKRKGAAVIHARLAGQGESKLVAVIRVAGLYVGGQHRIRWRHDSTQQNRRTGR